MNVGTRTEPSSIRGWGIRCLLLGYNFLQTINDLHKGQLHNTELHSSRLSSAGASLPQIKHNGVCSRRRWQLSRYLAKNVILNQSTFKSCYIYLQKYACITFICIMVISGTGLVACLEHIKKSVEWRFFFSLIDLKIYKKMFTIQYV